MILYVSIYLAVIVLLNRGKLFVSNVDLVNFLPSKFYCPVGLDVFLYICFQYSPCAIVYMKYNNS